MAGRAFIFRIKLSGRDRIEEALSSDQLIIGWANAAGLLDPALNREDFKSVIFNAYPDKSPINGTQHMWRFLREVNPGDLIVVPRANEIYFAEALGEPTFTETLQKEDTAYRRSVRWLNGKEPTAKHLLNPKLSAAITSAISTSREITFLYVEVARAANVPTMGSDWAQPELDAVVGDYRSMLTAELSGQPYNKSEHRRALSGKVRRSARAIEFKHQNISAVLEEIGLPWIKGYKPRHNYQDALAHSVDAIMASDEGAIPLPPLPDPAIDPDKVFVPAPSTAIGDKQSVPTVTQRIARKINQAARDARNRILGAGGEDYVVKLEKARLADLPHLAERVSNHAKEKGDGLGYDILSFDESGPEIYIEVKTTQGGIVTPFYISQSELNAAAELGAEYRLYRVFAYGTHPQVFVLEPPLNDALNLAPANFRATLRIRSEMAESFRYFAYGSNMSTMRLRERTPSCKVVSTAILPRHQLRFHKKSSDGSGKCNAFHTGKLGDHVLGVVFDIPKSEKAQLDKAEGLGSGYDEKSVNLILSNGEYVEAITYLATRSAVDDAQVPFDWYHSHVYAGAKEHGLPDDYIMSRIYSAKTKRDLRRR